MTMDAIKFKKDNSGIVILNYKTSIELKKFRQSRKILKLQSQRK